MTARTSSGITGVLRLGATLAIGLWPAAHPARAEATLDATAYTQYEDNGNVYDLGAGIPVPGSGSTQHGDRVATVGAAAKVAELLDLQKLYLNLSGSEARYDRYTALDHTEYAIDGGLKWRLGAELDGNLEAQRTRSMLPFYYLSQTQQRLVIQTEQRETASVNVRVTPDWRLEAAGYTRTLDAPIQQAANLNLRETSETATLEYVRYAKLTGGFGVNYLSGEYGAVLGPTAPTYHQSSAFLVADYRLSGLSSAEAQLGYTRRSASTASNEIAGTTGSLDYKRALTGKTSIDLRVSRLLNAEIANTGSEIDTSASASVKWQATYRVDVQGGYAWLKRFLPDQGLVPNTDRTDRLQTANLSVNYRARRWLTLGVYSTVQTNSSDAAHGGFNATVYGIKVTGQIQR